MKALTKYVKWLLALLILGLLISFVDLSEVFSALINCDLWLLTILIYLSFVMVAVSAFKWKRLLEVQRVPVTLWRANGLYLVGYFVNLLAPSYLGGDAVRSWAIGEGGRRHESFAATICERFTGLLAMSILAVTFVFFLPELPVKLQMGVVAIFLGLTLLGALAISEFFPKVLLPRLPSYKVLGHLSRLHDALKIFWGRKAALLEAMALSAVFHTLTVVNTAFALMAIGAPSVEILNLFIVLPFILLIGAIPITPSGLGVQEGAFVFFLGLIGVAPEHALAAAVLLRAKAYILAVAGGLFWYLSGLSSSHSGMTSSVKTSTTASSGSPLS